MNIGKQPQRPIKLKEHLMLDFTNLAKNALENDPYKSAIIINNQQISYREFEKMIEKHASCLAAHDLSKGDRVGLMSHNHQDLAALLFAVWRIGCIAVPLNYRYKSPEVEYALSHCNVGLVIIQDKLAEGLSATFKAPECTKHCYTLEKGVASVGTPWQLEAAKSHPPATANPPKGNDPAAIYFTSGSTSKPKGVTHTAKSIIETGRSRAETLKLDNDDIWLLSTQLVHVSASLGSLIPAMLIGGTVVFLEEFKPEDWLAAFKQHSPTRSVILPSLLHDILSCPLIQEVDLGSIRSMECGGDYVTPHLYSAWQKVSSEPLTQLIGMTECEGYSLRHPGDPVKQGSAGRPRSGVEVSIRDSAGKELPTGETGELCIRSSSMTIGYWQDPEHTEQTIRNGWLYSGDQGRIDEEGSLWFIGRFKEIIIKRGSNIAPGEVESILDNHSKISETAVVGTPPGVHGQRVVAFVETMGDEIVEIKTLKEWAANHIADYKIPDEWILVKTLPRNAVGKLDRAELHRRSKEMFPDG